MLSCASRRCAGHGHRYLVHVNMYLFALNNQHAHGIFFRAVTLSISDNLTQLSQEEEADDGKEVTWGTRC